MKVSTGENAISSDLLTRFYAADESSTAPLLSKLLEDEVRPTVDSVIRRSLSRLQRANPVDVEDLTQDSLLRVAQQLIAGHRGEARITSLSGYAARVAEYACDELFRRKFRKRYNAEKRVLVNLKDNDAFYTWPFGSEELHGALSQWPPPPPRAALEKRSALSNSPVATVGQVFAEFPDPDGKPVPLTSRILASCLCWAQGSLLVDDLVLAVQAARDEFDEPELELKPDLAIDTNAPDIGSEADFVGAIWSEIKRLRPLSAAALLLNLRLKGGLGMETFIEFGASGSEMAKLLGFETTDFEAEVLPSLPWEDRRIAERLGCTVEQVPTLRSTARRTIAARLVASGQFDDECFRFRL